MSPTKRFFLGFLSPELFGAYVILAIFSAILGATHYWGYGSFIRIWGVFVSGAIAVALLLVVFVGWFQCWLWRRVLKQNNPVAPRLPLVELLWRSGIVASVVLTASVFVAGRLCQVRAQNICSDTASLIAILERARKAEGRYPTNVVILTTRNTAFRRKYLFYCGERTTNGVDWDPRRIASSDISVFVQTNRFQLVVPIEKMSPITFSSFRVYSYTSEHPVWTRTLLHWSSLGAYIDELGK